MALIIKNKIGNTIPGTTTYSGKYELIPAIVGTTSVYEGQLVALDSVFAKATTSDIATNSKYYGVIAHENIRTELPGEGDKLQVFKKGEVVTVLIKGFIMALAENNFDGSTLKCENGIFKTTGIVELKSEMIKLTGLVEENKKLNKKLVEVEIK